MLSSPTLTSPTLTSPTLTTPVTIGQPLAGQVSASAATPSVTFIGPGDEAEIETAFGTLHVEAGALVLSVMSDESWSIYDLHDGKDDTVHVTADNQKFSLTPGKHLTLARPQCKNFAAVNHLPKVAYLSLDGRQINDHLISFYGNYDINSLVFSCPPFKKLLNSKDPKVRRVAENVLKTSAVLNNYSYMRRYQAGLPTSNRANKTK